MSWRPTRDLVDVEVIEVNLSVDEMMTDVVVARVDLLYFPHFWKRPMR